MGLSRADLARALADIAESDRTVAKVLAASEAWETGYVAGLLSRAEELVLHDPPEAYESTQEQALSAIDRAIRHDNPFLRVHRSGVDPSDEQCQAIIDFLRQQARFHGVAADLERRIAPRTTPPA